jgi:hypothetical protein
VPRRQIGMARFFGESTGQIPWDAPWDIDPDPAPTAS